MSQVKNLLILIGFIIGFILFMVINRAGFDANQQARDQYAASKHISLSNAKGMRCIASKLHYEIKPVSIIKYEPEVSCVSHDVDKINAVGRTQIEISGILMMVLFASFIAWGLTAIGQHIKARESFERSKDQS